MKNIYLNGKINVPSSKSIIQRILACSVFIKEKIIIENLNYCDDVNASISIIKSLGKKVERKDNKLIITNTNKYKNEINCLESGLSYRMFSIISSFFDKEIKINIEGSLKNRPYNIINEVLKELNVSIINDFDPLIVKGPIKKNNIVIDGSITSQILTGLLITMPNLKQDSIIKVKDLKSKGYIDMTINMLKDLGCIIENNNYETFIIKGNQEYKKDYYYCEGDWSSAAFFMVGACISGDIDLYGLDLNSYQKDKEILKIISQINKNVFIKEKYIKIKTDKLKPFNYDATHTPDLIPILTILASQCNGKSQIKGIHRLKFKESNREKALIEELNKIGIKINKVEDSFIIEKSIIKGANVSSHNDHRLAMSLAIANIVSEGEINIDNKNCVNKSYPNFWEDLKNIKKEG